MKKLKIEDIKNEADKRYGNMSFGNDKVRFIEGALWYREKSFQLQNLVKSHLK